jgi:hypothetical protein
MLETLLRVWPAERRGADRGRTWRDCGNRISVFANVGLTWRGGANEAP